MPRIRGSSIEEHHEMVWADLAEAIRQLLLRRDYDSITMGHIAARAGLARNTLYNYARDKSALVLALARRASRPVHERVAGIVARTPDPAAIRLSEVIEAILLASTDTTMRLMFLPNSGPLVAELEAGPDNPFRAIVAEVESLVREGIADGEFRDVGDVPLAVQLLSGTMLAGARRVGHDPEALEATTTMAQQIVLAYLRTPGPLETGSRTARRRGQ